MKHSLSIPLLLFAALLAWTLLTPRQTLLRPVTPPEATEQIADSYAVDVTALDFDTAGELTQSTQASRLRRFESAQVIELDAPQRENFGGDGNWVATARSGVLREGAETLQLEGDVLLQFAREGARLSSAAMLINLRQRSARSLAPVLLEQGDNRISAQDMFVALDSERVVLSGDVRSTYAPPR